MAADSRAFMCQQFTKTCFRSASRALENFSSTSGSTYNPSYRPARQVNVARDNDPSKASPKRSARAKYRDLHSNNETNFVKSMYRQIFTFRSAGSRKIGWFFSAGMVLFFRQR